MPLLEFLNQIEYEEIPMAQFEETALGEAKIKLIFNDINQLSDIKLKRVTDFCKKRVDELVRDYKKRRIASAPEILARKLRYKNPKIINLKQLQRGVHE